MPGHTQPLTTMNGKHEHTTGAAVIAVTPTVAQGFYGQLASLSSNIGVCVIPGTQPDGAGSAGSGCRAVLRKAFARFRQAFVQAPVASEHALPILDPDQAESVTGLVLDWGVGKELPEILNRLPRLAWVHVVKTGVDHLPLEELRSRRLVVSCSKGAYSDAVAEFAMGLVYLFCKRYLEHRALNSASGGRILWGRTLRGKSLLILGTGHIGARLAALAGGVGLTTLGVNTDGRPVAGFARTVSWREAGELASECALVVDCLPLTPATRNVVGKNIFSRLARGACYVNVGRIETVDQQALDAALRVGSLDFAALDAETADVRLSRDIRHKVLVTHHSAFATEESRRELARLLAANIEAFAAGQPLAGLVNLDAGY